MIFFSVIEKLNLPIMFSHPESFSFETETQFDGTQFHRWFLFPGAMVHELGIGNEIRSETLIRQQRLSLCFFAFGNAFPWNHSSLISGSESSVACLWQKRQNCRTLRDKKHLYLFTKWGIHNSEFCRSSFGLKCGLKKSPTTHNGEQTGPVDLSEIDF